MPTGVRLARTSDVDRIAAVQVSAWERLYGPLLEAAGLTLDATVIADAWAEAVLRPPTPAMRVLVATDEEQVVGFAAIGPALDPDLAGDWGEIHALVVDVDALRRGHGSRLMAACIDHLRAGGYQSAVTWTLLDDEPRRAFWQSAGWAPDTARRTLGGSIEGGESSATVIEVRLVVDISAHP